MRSRSRPQPASTRQSPDADENDARVPMDALNVNEIFYSIQGEGSRSGLPCVFVRLHGCGLRCDWCDTSYALDHRTGGTIRTLDDVLAEVARYHCRFIELTGG